MLFYQKETAMWGLVVSNGTDQGSYFERIMIELSYDGTDIVHIIHNSLPIHESHSPPSLLHEWFLPHKIHHIPPTATALILTNTDNKTYQHRHSTSVPLFLPIFSVPYSIFFKYLETMGSELSINIDRSMLAAHTKYTMEK